MHCQHVLDEEHEPDAYWNFWQSQECRALAIMDFLELNSSMYLLCYLGSLNPRVTLKEIATAPTDTNGVYKSFEHCFELE